MGPGGHCEVFRAFLHLVPNWEEGIDSWDLEVRPQSRSLLCPYLDTIPAPLSANSLSSKGESVTRLTKFWVLESTLSSSLTSCCCRLITHCQISRQIESHTCWVGIWRTQIPTTLSLRGRLHARIQSKTLHVYWSHWIFESSRCPLAYPEIPTEVQSLVPARARSPAGLQSLSLMTCSHFPHSWIIPTPPRSVERCGEEGNRTDCLVGIVSSSGYLLLESPFLLRVVEETPTLIGYPIFFFSNNILSLFFENFMHVYKVS